ncbi:MAG: hypothetical protein ACJ788_09680 [Ktedonobacteraceae bacterium]
MLYPIDFSYGIDSANEERSTRHPKLNMRIVSIPAVGVNLEGYLEVFASGSGQALWHIRQLIAGGAWST